MSHDAEDPRHVVEAFGKVLGREGRPQPEYDEIVPRRTHNQSKPKLIDNAWNVWTQGEWISNEMVVEGLYGPLRPEATELFGMHEMTAFVEQNPWMMQVHDKIIMDQWKFLTHELPETSRRMVGPVLEATRTTSEQGLIYRSGRIEMPSDWPLDPSKIRVFEKKFEQIISCAHDSLLLQHLGKLFLEAAKYRYENVTQPQLGGRKEAFNAFFQRELNKTFGINRKGIGLEGFVNDARELLDTRKKPPDVCIGTNGILRQANQVNPEHRILRKVGALDPPAPLPTHRTSTNPLVPETQAIYGNIHFAPVSKVILSNGELADASTSRYFASERLLMAPMTRTSLPDYKNNNSNHRDIIVLNGKQRTTSMLLFLDALRNVGAFVPTGARAGDQSVFGTKLFQSIIQETVSGGLCSKRKKPNRRRPRASGARSPASKRQRTHRDQSSMFHSDLDAPRGTETELASDNPVKLWDLAVSQKLDSVIVQQIMKLDRKQFRELSTCNDNDGDDEENDSEDVSLLGPFGTPFGRSSRPRRSDPVFDMDPLAMSSPCEDAAEAKRRAPPEYKTTIIELSVPIETKAPTIAMVPFDLVPHARAASNKEIKVRPLDKATEARYRTFMNWVPFFIDSNRTLLENAFDAAASTATTAAADLAAAKKAISDKVTNLAVEQLFMCDTTHTDEPTKHAHNENERKAISETLLHYYNVMYKQSDSKAAALYATAVRDNKTAQGVLARAAGTGAAGTILPGTKDMVNGISKIIFADPEYAEAKARFLRNVSLRTGATTTNLNMAQITFIYNLALEWAAAVAAASLEPKELAIVRDIISAFATTPAQFNNLRDLVQPAPRGAYATVNHGLLVALARNMDRILPESRITEIQLKFNLQNLGVAGSRIPRTTAPPACDMLARVDCPTMQEAETFMQKTDITFSLCEAMLAYNIEVPVSIQLFRMYALFEAGSLLFCQSGDRTAVILLQEVGLVFHNNPDTRTTTTDIHITSMTLVVAPESLHVDHNVMPLRYMGGAGVEFFPMTGTAVAEYNNRDGAFPWDIFATMVPYHYNPQDFYTPITGYLSTHLCSAEDAQVLHYCTAPLYATYWGWKDPGSQHEFSLDAMCNARAKSKVLAVRGSYYEWSGDGHGGGSISKLTSGLTALGPSCDPEELAVLQVVGAEYAGSGIQKVGFSQGGFL